MYNGIVLPALPGYNKSVYTHGFIQYGGVAGMEIYSLIVSTASGVMGDSYTVGEHTYSAWVVAANETAAENLSGAYPGISTKEWLQFEDGNTVTASTYDNIVWTNTDILKADGSVYLKASKPLDLDAFKIGLSLGLCGNALPWKKEPVAYLYNGVRLPPLPQRDKAKYPHMLINHVSPGASYEAIFVIFTSEPLVSYYDDEYRIRVLTSDGKPCLRGVAQYSYMSDKWNDILWSELTNEYNYNDPNVLWSNTNINNRDDGTVYVAASEPIPVYE